MMSLPVHLGGGLCLWAHVPSGGVSLWTETPLDRDTPSRQPPKRAVRILLDTRMHTFYELILLKNQFLPASYPWTTLYSNFVLNSLHLKFASSNTIKVSKY